MDKENNIKNPSIHYENKSLPKKVMIIDAYSSSIEELFFVRNPKYKKGMIEVNMPLNLFRKRNKIKPVWIFYPWRNKAVCIPEEDVYYELRTARNKDLISLSTQNKYREMVVGIIGLSIGSASIYYLSYTGGPKNIKLADFDTIEITNLNRMYASLIDYGENKTKVAAQKIWEIDPFANLFLFSEGITSETLEKFILEKPKLNVFIDAMDSLPLKIKARIICRANGIPVVMATSNGDSVIVDVERYDLEPNLALFNNRLGNINEHDFEYLNYKEWLHLATKIVGENILTAEMKESFNKIGKTLSSVPQLSTTVNLGGIILSYILRKISEDSTNTPSGRYFINLEDIPTIK